MDDQSNRWKSDEAMEEQFLRERVRRWGAPADEPLDPLRYPKRPRRSRWLAAIFAFLFPGAGHFYIGQMQRGLAMMLFLIADIAGIVFIATSASANIPLIVLLSLMIPVIYLYNIFDAVQQTEKVNRGSDMSQEFTDKPAGGAAKRGLSGYLLIAAGVILIIAMNKPEWLNVLWGWLGSSLGALILIGAGVYLFYKETKK